MRTAQVGHAINEHFYKIILRCACLKNKTGTAQLSHGPRSDFVDMLHYLQFSTHEKLKIGISFVTVGKYNANNRLCDDELKVCGVVLAQVESTNIRHHNSKMGKN
jgi:hypothetical protein